MIDAAHPAASWFLLVAAILFLTVFAIPLLISPLWWARAFRWQAPQRDDLAEYLGRCVGALAIAIVFACLRAARHPQDHLPLYELLVVAGSLLTLVHVWGALARRQPWTETAEIALYLLATGAFIWLRISL